MIRVRAFLVIFLITLLIVSFSIFVGIYTVKNQLETSQETELILLSDIADHYISSEISTIKAKANGIASLMSVSEEASWESILSRIESQHQEFIGAAVFDEQQKLLATAGTFPGSNDLIEDSFMHQSLSGDGVLSSIIQTDFGAVFYLATAFSGFSNNENHILVLTLPGSYFSDLLSSFVIWETGHIFLDDTKGHLVANPRYEWVENKVDFTQMAQIDKENDITVYELRQKQNQDVTIINYSIANVPRLCAYRPVSGSAEGWLMGVVAPLPESPYRFIDRGLISVGLVSILLGLIAAIIGSVFIKRPFIEIEALKEEAEAAKIEALASKEEAVEAKEEAVAAKEEAEAASKHKSDFLANMSHEIRTPMNSILGIAEILRRDEKLSDSANVWIEKIQSSGNLLLNIINDILDLSKIEAGKVELSPLIYETASLINDTSAFHMISIESKPIEFKINVDEKLPQLMLGDELHIKKILNNLLSNAFKYTENGEVILSFTALTDIYEVDEEIGLEIRVSDTGRGMTKEQINELFNRYTRFNTDSGKTIEGTGIGMSITQSLIDLMNGQITVESEPDVGSVFTVTIPQGIAGSEILGRDLANSLQNFKQSGIRQLQKAQIVYEPMPYGSILIVDDVESNLLIATGLMLPYELTMETATSGFQAIDLVSNGNVYDIIFMDHMMPKMDGIQALAEIRKLGYEGPVVALTANAVKGQKEVFLTHGFDGFVSKPIDVRELNTVLKKFIRDKQPPEVIDAARRESLIIKNSDEATTQISTSIPDRLAEAFMLDAQRTKEILQELMDKSGALTQEDLEAYTTATHGIKSALANIGELELSEFAAKLEQAGKSGMKTMIFTETPTFIDKLNMVIEMQIPLMIDDGYDDLEDGNLTLLHSSMLTIRDACESLDRKTVKDIVNLLQETKWESPVKELLSAILDYLLVGDFDEVLSAAETIIDYCTNILA
ncbi:MAG: ATP-binding protein [Oscillospiraceae bacterium]|nr:ATP-binding protein [Oscillospiraceae bacterium]